MITGAQSITLSLPTGEDVRREKDIEEESGEGEGEGGEGKTEEDEKEEGGGSGGGSVHDSDADEDAPDTPFVFILVGSEESVSDSSDIDSSDSISTTDSMDKSVDIESTESSSRSTSSCESSSSDDEDEAVTPTDEENPVTHSTQAQASPSNSKSYLPLAIAFIVIALIAIIFSIVLTTLLCRRRTSESTDVNPSTLSSHPSTPDISKAGDEMEMEQITSIKSAPEFDIDTLSDNNSPPPSISQPIPLPIHHETPSVSVSEPPLQSECNAPLKPSSVSSSTESSILPLPPEVEVMEPSHDEDTTCGEMKKKKKKKKKKNGTVESQLLPPVDDSIPTLTSEEVDTQLPPREETSSPVVLNTHTHSRLPTLPDHLDDSHEGSNSLLLNTVEMKPAEDMDEEKNTSSTLAETVHPSSSFTALPAQPFEELHPTEPVGVSITDQLPVDNGEMRKKKKKKKKKAATIESQLLPPLDSQQPFTSEEINAEDPNTPDSATH